MARPCGGPGGGPEGADVGTTPTDLSASAEGGVVTAAEGGGGAAVKTKFIIAWISLSPLDRSVNPRTTPV